MYEAVYDTGGTKDIWRLEWSWGEIDDEGKKKNRGWYFYLSGGVGKPGLHHPKQLWWTKKEATAALEEFWQSFYSTKSINTTRRRRSYTTTVDAKNGHYRTSLVGVPRIPKKRSQFIPLPEGSKTVRTLDILGARSAEDAEQAAVCCLIDDVRWTWLPC